MLPQGLMSTSACTTIFELHGRCHAPVCTGVSGSVAVRMHNTLSAAAGPITRLPVPLPDRTSVASMSSFCFFVLHHVRASRCGYSYGYVSNFELRLGKDRRLLRIHPAKQALCPFLGSRCAASQHRKMPYA